MTRFFLILFSLLLAVPGVRAQNTRIQEFQQPMQLTTIEWNGQHLLIGGSTDSAGGQSDFLLIRQDTALQVLSAAAYPDPGDAGLDEVKFIRQAPNGGLLLAGTSTDAISGILSVKLIRTSPQGTVLWARKCTAPPAYSISALTGMDAYSDGAAVISCVLRQPAADTYWGHTIKLTSAGSVQWEHTATLQDPSIPANSVYFYFPVSNVAVQGLDTVWVAWTRADPLPGVSYPRYVIPIYAGTASTPPDDPIWIYTIQEAPYVREIRLADPVTRKLSMLSFRYSSPNKYYLLQGSSAFTAENGLSYSYDDSYTPLSGLGSGSDFYTNGKVFARFTGTPNITHRNARHLFIPPVQDFVSVQDKAYAIAQPSYGYGTGNSLSLSFGWQGGVGCNIADTAAHSASIALPPPPQYFQPDLPAPAIQIQIAAITPGSVSLAVTDSLVCNGDGLIWPGDADHNGIANSVDVLYLGAAWGETGPLRPNGTTAWTGQPAGPDWGPQFSNFIDWKYADCDADGIVGQSDIQAVAQNYGLTHDRSGAGTAAEGPPLSLSAPADSAMAGDTIMADVFLGSPLDPADQLYGIAFTLTYDPTLVQEGSAAFIPDSSWFGEPGVSSAYLSKDFHALGKVEAALTRTDRIMVNGQGRIGSFMIIAIDNISGKTLKSRLLNLGIVPRFAMDLSQDPISIQAAGGDSVLVYQEGSSSRGPLSGPSLRIYPQPAAQEAIVECSHRMESVQLLTLHGQLLREIRPGGTQARFRLDGIAPGAYLIRIQSPAGLAQRMLIRE
ncbi:MAG: hypothetical protein NW241_15205 [Bacteroidia bacterium]|nr:hypothetical protein [Bacteroidia bacterium]